jgi:hypothetical protein
VGEGGLDLSVMGPAEELDKLREAFGPLGARFWETDGGSMWWGASQVADRSQATPDSHITICPTFTVPDGKLSAFTDAFPAFYAATKAGTDKCLYYGFAISDNHVFCREGYADAEGCLAHVGDVGEPLGAAVAMVGEGGLDLSVMGPAEELDKLREAFGPLGARFWETDGGSMWWG